jgi:hypothetical protein
LSRIANSVAVNQAVRMHQQSSTIAVQNVMQRQRMNRVLLSQVVREVVEVGPTTADLQRFIDIISREGEDPGLEFAQVETEIREHTPFAGVLRFLSNSQIRAEVWVILSVLVPILLYMLGQQQVVKVEVVAPSVDEIVERVMEQIEHQDQQPEPPATTAPECEEP